jgi:CoA binding domain
MCERGYDMVPVNLMAEEIEDRECFPCLQAVKPPVDGALVMTAFHQTLGVVRDCAEVVSRRREIVVLYERWRRALRSRLVGGGFIALGKSGRGGSDDASRDSCPDLWGDSG